MQIIGAYLIFLVGIVVITVGAVLCGAIGMAGIALYESAAWLRGLHPAAGRIPFKHN